MTVTRLRVVFLFVAGMVLIAGATWAFFTWSNKKISTELATTSNQQQTQTTQPAPTAPTGPTTQTDAPTEEKLNYPIKNFPDRITKKHFGDYITPKTSPVQPERFTGYHTGSDAEILPEEAGSDVSVFSIAEGKVRSVDQVSGYGGVAVVEYTIKGEAVTVLYGHLKKSSIHFIPGDVIKKGQKLGILGTGNSTETDGERKHLHISIHKGTDIELRGYVQSKGDLAAWEDPEIVLKGATEP